MKTISLITAIALVSAFAFYTLTPKSIEYSAAGSTVTQTEIQNNIEKMMPQSSKSTEKMSATAHLDSIVLGAGCFWGAEKRYQAIPGVVDAISGYADGKNVSATYREITQRKNKFN